MFKIDFIGIGAQKSGTTWIYDCLCQHPQICGSRKKEVHFFSTTYSVHDKKDGRENYAKGMEWYQGFFNHCPEDYVKGEFSVFYLYDEGASALIKKHFPGVKIIACLRNPIDRAFSQYLNIARDFNMKDNSDYLSFEKAVKKDLEIVERGLYYKQLKRYFDLFPKENILVLIYEDIQKNPIAFIQKIYKFLEVDDKFIPEAANKRVFTTRKNWLMKYRIKFQNGHRTGEWLIKNSKRLKIYYIIKKIIHFLMPEPSNIIKIKPETRKYLQNFYREDIENLEKLLGRDLNHWKN